MRVHVKVPASLTCLPRSHAGSEERHSPTWQALPTSGPAGACAFRLSMAIIICSGVAGQP